MIDSESAARVARGAEWLDEVSPGWERKLDLSNLHIDNPNQCVCGQVFMAAALMSKWHNGYEYAAMVHDLPYAASYGFIFPEDGDAWVALVKERFDSGLLSDMEATR